MMSGTHLLNHVCLSSDLLLAVDVIIEEQKCFGEGPFEAGPYMLGGQKAGSVSFRTSLPCNANCMIAWNMDVLHY